MTRVTARLLLILLLVISFAPAAVAITTPSVRSCCIRQGHRFLGHAQILDLPGCCRRGACALPLTVFLWAALPPQATFFAAPFRITLQSQRDVFHRITRRHAAGSVRAPPLSPIA